MRRVWKKIRQSLRGRRTGNDGAALVSVLIVCLFVLLLGSALLYASYNLLVYSAAQKKSENQFTGAEAGMQEIRAGFTEIVSDAAGEGYNRILSSYSGGSTKTLFDEGFRDYLTSYWEDLNGNGVKDADETLFRTASGQITGYNLRVLRNWLDQFAKDSRKADGSTEYSYTLTALASAGSAATPVATDGMDSNSTVANRFGSCTTDGTTVTMKNLRLTYIKDGYETFITTDLTVTEPDIPAGSTYQPSGLEDYVIVADQGIDLTDASAGGSLTVAGDTYTGSLNISKALSSGGNAAPGVTVEEGHSLIVGQTAVYTQDSHGAYSVSKKNTDGTVQKTDGAVTIDGVLKYGNSRSVYSSPKMTLGERTTLWANEISISGGSFTMDGGKDSGSNVYVQDDLTLGRDASVTLSGSYFGFGNGNTADTSSSILFGSVAGTTQNAADPSGSIDFTNLDALTLAGRSFVLNKKNGSEQIGMGSSVTARPEQLAYLVPAEYLDGKTNPYISDGSSDEAVRISLKNSAVKHLSDTLWTISGTPKKLSDYGISDANQIAVLSYPIVGSSQYVWYTFMDFPTREEANAYFRDFFSQNAKEVASYLDQYAEIKGNPGSQNLVSPGIVKNADGTYALAESGSDQTAAALDAKADELRNTYKLLSKSTTTKDTEDAMTPFRYYIDTDKLHDLLNDSSYSELKDSRGQTVAGSVRTTADGKGRYRELWYPDQNGYYQSDHNFIIAEGDVSINASAQQHMIICDGNVTVENNDIGQGLVMCSGTFHVKNQFKLSKNGELDLVDLLKNYGHGIWKGGSDSGGSEGNGWTADELVRYENWKKN